MIPISAAINFIIAFVFMMQNYVIRLKFLYMQYLKLYLHYSCSVIRQMILAILGTRFISLV